MRRAAGLHAEITLTTALLVGAALLFGGFLLLRLTEQELLDQRSQGVRETLQVLAGAFALPGTSPAERLPGLVKHLGADLVDWRYYDSRGMLAAATGPAGGAAAEAAFLVQQARMLPGPQLLVTRPQLWLPGFGADPGYVSAAVALPRPGGLIADVFWARFSLASMQQQLLRAHRLMLLYVFLYGSVLTVFGVVALRRNVVRPVRRLQQAIGQVAAGDLEATAPESGPREIAELAASFNSMTRALRTGRDALLRSERMASVGHLSAGMAHEIGNPLAAVIGYLELLRQDLPVGPTREIVQHSLRETARIDRLVRDLLDYAAPDEAVPGPFDPAPVLREVVALLASQPAFAGYALHLDCPETLPAVRLSPHKLQQVLVNLVGNARDASAPGETISVAAGTGPGRVDIRIRDAGSGIPEESRSQIFDPFFTTKPVGQGRGLGLTVCHRIIAEAGGTIDVVSSPEAGSLFTIALPAAGAEQD